MSIWEIRSLVYFKLPFRNALYAHCLVPLRGLKSRRSPGYILRSGLFFVLFFVFRLPVETNPNQPTIQITRNPTEKLYIALRRHIITAHRKRIRVAYTD